MDVRIPSHSLSAVHERFDWGRAAAGSGKLCKRIS
jgi:hypothetical protein